MTEYGLIGRTLGHSFSKDYFNGFFKKEGIDAAYNNYELETAGQLTELINTNRQLAGLNVTIPYKQQVMHLLTDIDAEASEVGAVNVIKIELDKDGKPMRTTGYNTDITGFWQAISPLLKPCHTKALVLGTGGAATAVNHVLTKNNIKTVLVSRKEHDGSNYTTYEKLTRDIMQQHTVIVNCTPCGTIPDTDTCPPINYGWISDRHLCFDLVYNPAETLFMKKAAGMGATVSNGYTMLIKQAEESWRIWNTEKKNKE